MKLSVLIPTFNSSAVIQATLESVLRQTAPPDEILVLDDGSTDNTVSLLSAYKPRVSVFRQENKGVASARNALCGLAGGDLIAFLDHDDIWHPRYLEVQRILFGKYPHAAAFFTGHVNFYGYESHHWDAESVSVSPEVELMDSLSFFNRYNKATGPFASMSYCCVPKVVLSEIGTTPFRVSGVDDSYLCGFLPLLGRPVVRTPKPLVAYRITNEAQSTNKLRDIGLWVEVFQLLQTNYGAISQRHLAKSFQMAFAAKRRQYAKLLMGANRTSDARGQLLESLKNSKTPVSLAKSLALLLLTWVPSQIQPAWPPSSRT